SGTIAAADRTNDAGRAECERVRAELAAAGYISGERLAGREIRRSANRASTRTFETGDRRDETRGPVATGRRRCRARGRRSASSSVEFARGHAAAACLEQDGLSRPRGQSIDARGARTSPADRQIRLASRARERSEEHTSELQSRSDIVCRLLLEKKNSNK